MNAKEIIERFSGTLTDGKTKIIILPNFVVKLFPRSKDINPEVDALTTIRSNNIVKLLYFQKHSPAAIVYAHVYPLKEIINPTRDELVKQIRNVATALYDIHSAGYTHGDVAIGNIGMNKDKEYVLYDFEDVKRDTSSEGRYKDVEMFLEDFIYQYRNHLDLQAEIKHLLKELQIRHRKGSVIRKRMPTGKTREMNVFSYRYDSRDFRVIVGLNLKNF